MNSESKFDDIIVTNCLKKRIEKVAFRDKKRSQSVGFSINTPGHQMGVYVKNPANKTGSIKSVSYVVNDFFKGKKLNAPARFHLYEYDKQLEKIGEEITNEVIELIPLKTGWVTIDLSKYNLKIPAEGVLITFEMFDAGEEFYFDRKVTVGKKKEIMKCYGWGLETREDQNNFLMKRPGGDWVNGNFFKDQSIAIGL